MSSNAISHTEPPTSTHAAHWGRYAERVRAHAETTKSSLTLNLRTAEGDTVELSFDATGVKQQESATARTSQGTVSTSSASQSLSYNFTAKVTGNLSNQEVTDIASVIQSLEGGHQASAPLSTVAAYAGTFQQTTSVADGQIKAYL